MHCLLDTCTVIKDIESISVVCLSICVQGPVFIMDILRKWSFIAKEHLVFPNVFSSKTEFAVSS